MKKIGLAVILLTLINITFTDRASAYERCIYFVKRTFKAYLSEKELKNKDVLIVIHGGLASRKAAKRMCKKFKAHFGNRFVIVSVDYPPALFGTTEVRETVNTIKWIKRHNPSSIGLIGKSRGGYIALMSSAKADVDYVISISAPTDMWYMFNFIKKRPKKFASWNRLARKSEKVCRKYKKSLKKCAYEISPISYASKIKEPVFIIHGTNDKTVPYINAIYMAKSFMKAKKKNYFLYILPATHDIDIFSPFIKRLILDFISMVNPNWTTTQ